MKTKFSIRYKFLAVTMLLLAVCVGTYLLLASHIFKEDKRGLVFDYNRSLVVNLASDLDNFFKGLSDKMQLVAYFHRKDDKTFQRLLKDLLAQNRDLVWIGSSENFHDIYREYYRDADYQKTYGLEDDFFTHALPTGRPVPFDEIRRDGEAFWSATLPENGPALIGYGKNVIEENAKGVPQRQFVVVAFVKADRIMAALKESQPSESMVMSLRGDILAHTNPEVLRQQHMPDVELFTRAKKLKMRAQVLKYESGEQERFGAFAKAGSGRLIVLSSIAEATAFKAVNDLVFRSLLFGSILVTLAFILAIFFSRSLTRPIEVLVGGMKKVSDGDLSTHLTVESHDEIASLADHFNRMIGDLKKSREELENINRELEDKVRERTRQLEERNLAVKEAQEALLRSTRLAAVGEVAGIAAHEVLNPLTSIISKLNDLKTRLRGERAEGARFLLDLKRNWEKDFSAGGFPALVKAWQTPSSVQQGASLWQEDLGNLEKVGTGVLDEFDKLVRDSEYLLEESERISRIVQSFRGLSSAKADVRAQSVYKLCDRSITIMADLAAKYDVRIQKEFVVDEGQGDELALVDEDEFIQVITNLLRNAIQSVASAQRPAGAGEITVRASVDEKEGGRWVHLAIRDNGQGITPDVAKKIFNQKFTTKSKNEGTGIGLSLSRRLIRAFKGDIQMTWSEPGQGAEFCVHLPLVTGASSGALGRSA